MATAHYHFAEAERFAEAAQLLFSYTSESSDTAFDQETFEAMTAARTLAAIGLLHATLAHAAALGANDEPLPGLDHYCLCPLTPPVEAFTHTADCPHNKPTNDGGSTAPTAEPHA